MASDSSASDDLENLPKDRKVKRSRKRRSRGHHSESDQEKAPILSLHHISFSLEDYEILPGESARTPGLAGHELLFPNFCEPRSLEVKSNITGSSGADSGLKMDESLDESRNYTRRQWMILIVYSFTEFCSGTIISLQSPFYPAEAEKKGLSASEYGAVFGVFEFIVFLASFVYGKYMGYVGPKFVYNFGLFVSGVCCVLFGLLDRVQGRTLFFGLSMVTRIFEALAAAGCISAAFTIVALEFPKTVATSFATMETCFAVGLTCGPIIGGVLFELGGYPLPFFSLGILLALVSIFTYFVLPPLLDENDGVDDSKGLLQLLKIPEVMVVALVIFSTALSIGHLVATLEPHIRMFNLSSIGVGLVIVIDGAVYAILTPVWGTLCDKLPRLDVYMLVGCILIIAGFLLVGPAPFLPMDTILWVTCVGLAVEGVGLGGCLVSSFIQLLTSANAHGFPDNVSTYGMVSGIWASLFSLGNFVGPTLAGVLYDTVGFRNGTMVVVGLEVIVVIAIVWMMCFGKKPKPGTKRRLSEFTESDALLGSTKA